MIFSKVVAVFGRDKDFSIKTIATLPDQVFFLISDVPIKMSEIPTKLCLLRISDILIRKSEIKKKTLSG